MYVKDLYSSKWLLGIMGITILFIALAGWIGKCYRNRSGLIYFLPMIVPAILIIPGAVEYRYSIPFYIFAISQVCINIDWKELYKKFMGSKVTYICIYVYVLLTCFTIWSSMLASEYVTKLFL